VPEHIIMPRSSLFSPSLFFVILIVISGRQVCECTQQFVEDEYLVFPARSAAPSTTLRANNDMSTATARPGYPAPQFEAEAVVDGQFKRISLKDYAGKYVVLLFYPLDFTFVCPTEIIAFSDAADEFRKINTEVLAISVDSKYTHLAWINTPRNQGGLGKLNIPLVSDLTKEIATKYGVLYKDTGHTLRGLFIIGSDEKQTLRQVTMNEPPVGRSVDETLRLVKAFQYTDTHDEVCPVNWTPGKATIKPHPEKKLEYFAHQK
jgi:alkyl hydroperoxide reductase subunit AhpC